MGEVFSQSILDDLVSQVIQKRNIFGTVISVVKGDESVSLVSAAGNLEEDEAYFIASVTKLYVTTILLQLRAEGYLQLEDKIVSHLPKELIHSIHVLNGIDYTDDITIRHLMSNTSGIPDYFTAKAFSELKRGVDQSWPLAKSLAAVKKIKPKFKPGEKEKVQYSDTNYQLLGKIIERITGKSISTVFREQIFTVLNLRNTYVFENVQDDRPALIYYRSKSLEIPKYLSSIPAEGGIVSTARETMTFLKAFFNGQFFSKEQLKEITSTWRFLLVPGQFYYGIGISRQPLTLKQFPRGGLLGHWGQTGAFAFYHKEKDIYFAGTVNQAVGQGTAASLMRKILKYF